MKVFISHSLDDGNKYDDLCLAFENGGINYWNPKDLPAGYSLRDKLKAAIRQCPVCVFVATQKSLQSGWCQAEIGAFWGIDKPVIVWLADANVSASDLPEQFQGDIYATAMRDVLRSVQSHLEKVIHTPDDNQFELDDYTILVGPPMKLEGIDMSGVEWDRNNCYIVGPDFKESITLEPSRIGNSFVIRLRKPFLKKILLRKAQIALDIKDTEGNHWKTAPISLVENFVYLKLSKKGTVENGGNG